MVISINQFRAQFEALTAGWDWEVQGFLDSNGYVHPIDTDTKVISTVFERIAAPVIRTIANENLYRVELANQTTYPDFTMTHGDTGHRIGLDVKTTYLRPAMVLTLGGYASFLRNNTKNILHPYNTYSEHWILGFVYKQVAPHQEYDLRSLPKPDEINCPYEVRMVFLRNKHEICGLRAGSGNTKNIGSIKVRSAEQFRDENGPFSQFRDAKGACDHFWRNYETYIRSIYNAETLYLHPDFQVYR